MNAETRPYGILRQELNATSKYVWWCQSAKTINIDKCPCVKSVSIRSFSGPQFPEFGWNTEFTPNVGKCGPEQLRIRKLFTQCVSLDLNWYDNFITLMEQKLYEVVVKNVRVLSWGVLNTNLIHRTIRMESRNVAVIGLSVKKRLSESKSKMFLIPQWQH